MMKHDNHSWPNIQHPTGDLLPAVDGGLGDRGAGLLQEHAPRRERHLLLALPPRRQLVGKLHHLHVARRQGRPESI